MEKAKRAMGDDRVRLDIVELVAAARAMVDEVDAAMDDQDYSDRYPPTAVVGAKARLRAALKPFDEVKV